VPEPGAVRDRLLVAGARPGYAGLMLDRRYDRNGELMARDEVLRLRVYRDRDGGETAKLGWKGPTSVTRDGLKARRELEYDMHGAHGSPELLLTRLGFEVVFRIDRYVEYYHLGPTVARLEWYPRMDVLLEVEGDSAGIAAAVRISGVPRGDFTADALPAFAERYAARTGQPPVLALDPESSEPPSWEAR
jgi:hypothetical protein